jgi:RNase P/RNase MRP subunit p29
MHGELIGKVVTIRESSNKNQIGMKGKIIDERMHAFLIKTENGDKTILKRNAVFSVDGCKIYVNDLEKRPQSR